MELSVSPSRARHRRESRCSDPHPLAGHKHSRPILHGRARGTRGDASSARGGCPATPLRRPPPRGPQPPRASYTRCRSSRGWWQNECGAETRARRDGRWSGVASPVAGSGSRLQQRGTHRSKSPPPARNPSAGYGVLALESLSPSSSSSFPHSWRCRGEGGEEAREWRQRLRVRGEEDESEERGRSEERRVGKECSW